MEKEISLETLNFRKNGADSTPSGSLDDRDDSSNTDTEEENENDSVEENDNEDIKGVKVKYILNVLISV